MDNYESGNPVEGEFVQSWDRIEEFFGLEFDRVSWKDRVLQFIAQLRRAGCDRELRAGQTLDMLVLSRSRRHGLRPDQPRVVFGFRDGLMDVLEGNEERIRRSDISLSPQVEAVLAMLLSHPID